MSPRMRSFPGLLGESPEPGFFSRHLLEDEPKEIQNGKNRLSARRLQATSWELKLSTLSTLSSAACFTTVKPWLANPKKDEISRTTWWWKTQVSITHAVQRALWKDGERIVYGTFRRHPWQTLCLTSGGASRRASLACALSVFVFLFLCVPFSLCHCCNSLCQSSILATWKHWTCVPSILNRPAPTREGNRTPSQTPSVHVFVSLCVRVLVP